MTHLDSLFKVIYHLAVVYVAILFHDSIVVVNSDVCVKYPGVNSQINLYLAQVFFTPRGFSNPSSLWEVVMCHSKQPLTACSKRSQVLPVQGG